MRVLLILACITLTACAPSTDALVREAQQSGNWTMVNKRMADEGYGDVTFAQCEQGQLLMCKTSMSRTECFCEFETRASNTFDDLLGRDRNSLKLSEEFGMRR